MDEPVTHIGDVVVHYRATERRLRPGDRLTFGREPGPSRPGPSTDPHLGLSPSPALHALAGRLTVDATGCVLDNTGR